MTGGTAECPELPLTAAEETILLGMRLRHRSCRRTWCSFGCSPLIPDLSGLVITASVIWVLRFKVACCNLNLTEITDDPPQSRPRRQLCESAARGLATGGRHHNRGRDRLKQTKLHKPTSTRLADARKEIAGRVGSGGWNLPDSCSRSQASAALAQLVEHLIRNEGVGGSSPSCGTSLSPAQGR